MPSFLGFFDPVETDKMARVRPYEGRILKSHIVLVQVAPGFGGVP